MNINKQSLKKKKKKKAASRRFKTEQSTIKAAIFVQCFWRPCYDFRSPNTLQLKPSSPAWWEHLPLAPEKKTSERYSKHGRFSFNLSEKHPQQKWVEIGMGV